MSNLLFVWTVVVVHDVVGKDNTAVHARLVGLTVCNELPQDGCLFRGLGDVVVLVVLVVRSYILALLFC